MSKKIVIVGAGYTGTLVAKNLAKKFPDPKSAEVTLIDRHPFHTMMTELHEVAAARVEEDSIRVDLNEIFKNKNVNFVVDEIASIDFQEQIVKTEKGQYSYDYLTIATGSKPTYYGVKGAEEHCKALWSYEDANELRSHIEMIFELARKEADDAEREKLLTFCVVGAGFTGVEMAGELAEWIPSLCLKNNISQKEVRIIECDLLDRVVPTLPEELSEKVKGRLTSMGVEILLKTNVLEVGYDFLVVQMPDKEVEIPTKTVIWTAGIEGSELVEELAEYFPVAGRLRVAANEYLQAKDMEGIYVGGDNLFREYNNVPVAQVVENAEQTADVIANNIYVDVTGRGDYHAYQPAFHGVMVCVGGRYGVANVGLPNKMFQLSSLPAMSAKHFMNVFYLTKVAGVKRACEYLKHEFLRVPDKRHFLAPRFKQPWQ